jgi:prepilin-type N-terminal cleavage/methylation domain-containing protein
MKAGPRRAFTLIELLIVIAIILVLIAIALPNFLEAQIRAKVVRVQGDQRTIYIAIEQYAIDRKTYMPYSSWGPHGTPGYFNVLTSPVRYLTNIDAVSDPFFDPEIQGVGGVRYGYYSDGLTSYNHFVDGSWLYIRNKLRVRGAPYWKSVRYCITSAGPDLELNVDSDSDVMFYNPTNGTNSRGDLLRFGPL